MFRILLFAKFSWHVSRNVSRNVSQNRCETSEIFREIAARVVCLAVSRNSYRPFRQKPYDTGITVVLTFIGSDTVTGINTFRCWSRGTVSADVLQMCRRNTISVLSGGFEILKNTTGSILGCQGIQSVRNSAGFFYFRTYVGMELNSKEFHWNSDKENITCTCTKFRISLLLSSGTWTSSHRKHLYVRVHPYTWKWIWTCKRI